MFYRLECVGKVPRKSCFSHPNKFLKPLTLGTTKMRPSLNHLMA